MRVYISSRKLLLNYFVRSVAESGRLNWDSKINSVGHTVCIYEYVFTYLIILCIRLQLDFCCFQVKMVFRNTLAYMINICRYLAFRRTNYISGRKLYFSEVPRRTAEYNPFSLFLYEVPGFLKSEKHKNIFENTKLHEYQLF